MQAREFSRGFGAMCRLGAIIGDLQAAKPFVASFRELAGANRDGFGFGGFVDGVARIERSAMSALDHPGFGQEPWMQDARSVVMHLRKATSGPARLENTHPFHVGDRIVVHNGTFGDVGRVDAMLGADLSRLNVRGDTDSERLAALLVRETEAAGGDDVEGYRRALAYLADEHPMTSLTSIDATPNGDLYVVRYPENRTVFWKRHGARDAEHGHRLLAGGSDAAPRRDGAFTVVASRPLDASPDWQELPPGSLLHVRANDLGERLVDVIDREPAVRYSDEFRDVGMPWSGERRSTMLHADLGA